MQSVAALFVDPKGPYWSDPRCDCWDENRDAREYRGPLPVIAHPPCAAWCKMASLRELRYGMPVGIDAGCFASALQSVARWGGVLEHPAGSLAWSEYGLTTPVHGDWMPARDITGRINWVTEVWQVDYGHRARKATWLLYVGSARPAPMRFEKRDHSACVSGSTNRTKRSTGGGNRVWSAEAKRTPLAFADALIELAANCWAKPVGGNPTG